MNQIKFKAILRKEARRGGAKEKTEICFTLEDVMRGLVVFHYPEHWVFVQSTGLKDKNGEEIHDGDVVKVPDDYEEYGFMAGEQREIYYLDGCFRLKPRKENTRDRGNTIADDMDKCEIIGNIYENPNLI